MKYIFDTNIVLHFIRESPIKIMVENTLLPFADENEAWISAVTIGELRSIAMQNRWGANRLSKLDTYLAKFLISDVNIEELHHRYAEIDAFSQAKHPSIPSKFSARNMGKNDLWIAATASLLEGTLLTTDNDFSHLQGNFLKVEKF